MQIGSRMKQYEGLATGSVLMPRLPSVARIDGRNFHTYTKKMDRPYDEQFSTCMVRVALYLAKAVRADVVYLQSDEISIGWNGYDVHPFFEGRIFKINSILAAMASVEFNTNAPLIIDNHKLGILVPLFDARVFSVPNDTEFYNYFLWREMDATKNSVSMAARAYYSHREVDNKNTSEKQEMLFQKGINWNDYPSQFKRGLYITRKTVVHKVVNDGSLPPKHHFVNSVDGEFERKEYVISAKSLLLDKCDIVEL